MPVMSAYCKAIPIVEMARFEGWNALAKDGFSSSEPTAKSYLFLHDSYVVTEGVFADEQVVVSAPSEDWKRFCLEALNFRPEEFEEGESVGTT